MTAAATAIGATAPRIGDWCPLVSIEYECATATPSGSRRALAMTALGAMPLDPRGREITAAKPVKGERCPYFQHHLGCRGRA